MAIQWDKRILEDGGRRLLESEDTRLIENTASGILHAIISTKATSEIPPVLVSTREITDKKPEEVNAVGKIIRTGIS